MKPVTAVTVGMTVMLWNKVVGTVDSVHNNGKKLKVVLTDGVTVRWAKTADVKVVTA